MERAPVIPRTILLRECMLSNAEGQATIPEVVRCMTVRGGVRSVPYRGGEAITGTHAELTGKARRLADTGLNLLLV